MVREFLMITLAAFELNPVLVQEAVDFIKQEEGFSAQSYHDGGKISVGYGLQVPAHCVVTKTEAEKSVYKITKERMLFVLSKVKVVLSDNQLVALTSFCYNVGQPAFAKSRLLGLLNEGRYVGAGKELLRWNKSNGKVSGKLIKRRQREYRLFISAGAVRG